MEPPVWELTITGGRDEETYAFNLNDPKAGGLSFQERMRVPRAVRDDIVGRVAGGAAPTADAGFDDRLRAAGDLLFRRMLPRSIQDVLAKLEGGYLTISTEDPAVLWESAYFDGGFLAQRVAVARRMIARRFPDSRPVAERPVLGLLVVADPTDDLRRASTEADAIETLFREEALVHVRVLRGQDASTGNVLDALNEATFDVVHFAGHVDAPPGAEPTLRLSDAEVTASYLADQLGQLPEIVFVNGCSSGTETDAVDEEARRRGDWIASMAETFLYAGVGAYLGTLWDVADDAASRIAGRFYEALLDDATVGDALLAGRRAAADLGAAGWGAYLLYGRPNARIATVRPVIERRRNLKGLRTLLTSASEVERRQAAIRLGELGFDEATPELADACHDPSEAVRWRAVEGLAKIGSRPALDALAAYLVDADRDSALQVLVVARGRFTAEHWDEVSALADPPHDQVVRASAIAALSGIPHDQSRARLASFLDDDDPLIQWAALNGLARLGDLAVPVLEIYQPDDVLLERRRQRIIGASPRAGSPAVPRPDTAVPIILDCDAGLDDCLAVALAALHPDCSFEAVSIVGGGNASVADGVEIVSGVLQLCGRDDVPVLGGIGRAAASGSVAAERSNVFEQLADLVLHHDGRCVVVATGPLTNVAVLLRAFPQLIHSIREIVFLGCAFATPGNVGPIQEANVCADPEAADAVFRSGARVRIVSLDVSQQLLVGAVDADKLAGGRLLHRQLAVMLGPLVAYYRVVFGRDGCPIHDPLAVALALRPDLFKLRRAAVAVELAGHLTRGVTVRDDRPEAEGDNLASGIEIVEGADLDAVRQLLVDVLDTRSAADGAFAVAPSARH